MFIELTEYLRCPSGHGDEYLVLTPDKMKGRVVVSGTLGCPVCKRDFRIEKRVANLGNSDTLSASTGDIGAEDVQALLNIKGAGGYVALVGSAAELGSSLSELLEEVHLVGVNAPVGVEASDGVSLVTARLVPLRSQVVRGVVVGSEQGDECLEDAARVLLKGLRMVVTAERSDLPEGINLLATGSGLTVGEKV